MDGQAVAIKEGLCSLILSKNIYISLFLLICETLVISRFRELLRLVKSKKVERLCRVLTGPSDRGRADAPPMNASW